MSESKTWFCRTEEDTAEIGRKLASIARRGDCFALYGTLGMAKAFSAGLLYAVLPMPEKCRARPSPWFRAIRRKNLKFIISISTG